MGRKGIAPIFGLVAACLALCGCSSRTNGLRAVPEIPDAAGTAFVQRAQSAQSQKIQHVVIVIQENRSFDDLFYGFPGANTATSGKNSQGQTVALQPVALEAPYGIQHSSKMFFTACDGKPRGRNCLMDAF